MEQERYRGRYFRVTSEEMGPDWTYERVYQRHGVTVFPIMPDGTIRFIRITSIDDANVEKVKPMSGYIEDGEEALDCAKRELAEELELEGNLQLFCTASGEGSIVKTQYFFTVVNPVAITKFFRKDQNEKLHGYVDLTPKQAWVRTMAGEFGTGQNAFALTKLLIQLRPGICVNQEN